MTPFDCASNCDEHDVSAQLGRLIGLVLSLTLGQSSSAVLEPKHAAVNGQS
jgi:hypothetical protein